MTQSHVANNDFRLVKLFLPHLRVTSLCNQLNLVSKVNLLKLILPLLYFSDKHKNIVVSVQHLYQLFYSLHDDCL